MTHHELEQVCSKENVSPGRPLVFADALLWLMKPCVFFRSASSALAYLTAAGCFLGGAFFLIGGCAACIPTVRRLEYLQSRMIYDLDRTLFIVR